MFNPIEWLRSFFKTKTTPKQIDHRNKSQEVAIVLVHGFTGDTRATWANFVDLLLAEPGIKSWDLFGIGYPSEFAYRCPKSLGCRSGYQEAVAGVDDDALSVAVQRVQEDCHCCP